MINFKALTLLTSFLASMFIHAGVVSEQFKETTIPGAQKSFYLKQDKLVIVMYSENEKKKSFDFKNNLGIEKYIEGFKKNRKPITKFLGYKDWKVENYELIKGKDFDIYIEGAYTMDDKKYKFYEYHHLSGEKLKLVKSSLPKKSLKKLNKKKFLKVSNELIK